MTRALEQLIEEWRKIAAIDARKALKRDADESDSTVYHVEAQTLQMCADELEAALALPGEPDKIQCSWCETQHTDKMHSWFGAYFCDACWDEKERRGFVAPRQVAALPGGRESKEEPFLTAEQVLAEVERQERAQTAQEEK